ncbi:hypothetical protein COV61_00600 [Candidatus Micrarchaeota archaeon CG11_big_fil_rev_8_21_14_0_20_47_5]|nr:MAG: hypothetical protein COV61_00600 [Candidatus Micrarchaeota archaeon CG11_big_fil_rev_8_21_14_0_20_47_5]
MSENEKNQVWTVEKKKRFAANNPKCPICLLMTSGESPSTMDMPADLFSRLPEKACSNPQCQKEFKKRQAIKTGAKFGF